MLNNKHLWVHTFRNIQQEDQDQVVWRAPSSRWETPLEANVSHCYLEQVWSLLSALDDTLSTPEKPSRMNQRHKTRS